MPDAEVAQSRPTDGERRKRWIIYIEPSEIEKLKVIASEVGYVKAKSGNPNPSALARAFLKSAIRAFERGSFTLDQPPAEESSEAKAG